MVAHGVLPYRLRFVAEVTDVVVPRRLSLRAEGDLFGTGCWSLTEGDSGTSVAFEWRVRADKPIIQLLSPVIKPLFEWNHRWTMKKGEEALVRLLQSSVGVPGRG